MHGRFIFFNDKLILDIRTTTKVQSTSTKNNTTKWKIEGKIKTRKTNNFKQQNTSDREKKRTKTIGHLSSRQQNEPIWAKRYAEAAYAE
jgi:hypothetical protein